MPNPIHESFSDVPLRNVSPVSMTDPNENIQIYSGNFTLRSATKEYQVNGDVFFKWFPDMGVKFRASFTTKVNPSIYEEFEEFEIIVEDQLVGKIILTDLDLTGKQTCGGEAQNFIWGEGTISVNEVTFAIPNMREFLGSPVKELHETGIKLHKSRLILEDKPYKIVIDKAENYKEREKKLEENGGYLLTYLGKITKNKGAISLSDLHKWHDRFHHFLYFLNGRRIAPMFYTGSFDGQNKWTDFSEYSVDTYKNVPCWSNIMFLNDLPALWKSYNKLWKEENNQDFLITAIHWYVEANSNAGRIEGSIILIQTALELIYNWMIVENQKMIIGADAEGLSAANKIRMLIFQFKISPDIPPAFKALAKALPNVADGPEAFTKIRNALVHGQESKRSELKKIDLRAKYQALQLGIWYVELALLFILDYKGKYNNRTDGNYNRNTGTLVPWVNDRSLKIGAPSEFSEDQINSFVELLEKQGKVESPSEAKVRKCKIIAIGFSWGKPVAIGAIKPKTASDFKIGKANVPDLTKDYEWEVGYFYTEPEHEGKKFSSIILDHLMKKNGPTNLLATTEIREGNRMIYSLEHRGFKPVGSTWKSSLSGNDLRLFLKDINQEQKAIADSLAAFAPGLLNELDNKSGRTSNDLPK